MLNWISPYQVSAMAENLASSGSFKEEGVEEALLNLLFGLGSILVWGWETETVCWEGKSEKSLALERLLGRNRNHRGWLKSFEDAIRKYGQKIGEWELDRDSEGFCEWQRRVMV